MTDITDIGQNPDTSWIFHDFPCFERYKPLQTFSTSTTLRVRHSVRCLGLYSRRNIRKTSKIRQISRRKRIQELAVLALDEYVRTVHRPYPAQTRWKRDMKHCSLVAQPQLRNVIYAASCYAASIIYESFQHQCLLVELGCWLPSGLTVCSPSLGAPPAPAGLVLVFMFLYFKVKSGLFK